MVAALTHWHWRWRCNCTWLGTVTRLPYLRRRGGAPRWAGLAPAQNKKTGRTNLVSARQSVRLATVPYVDGSAKKWQSVCRSWPELARPFLT